jgi:hypothetical protein
MCGVKEAEKGAQMSQQQSMLELLPTELLPLIASDHSLRTQYGHPMLGVSRGCRDVVLSGFKKAKLELKKNTSLQPSARLLHRICCQAPQGLELELDLSWQDDALPSLVQPGLQIGGWPNVHALKVRARLNFTSQW